MNYPYSNVPIISIDSPETVFLSLCLMAMVISGIIAISLSFFALYEWIFLRSRKPIRQSRMDKKFKRDIKRIKKELLIESHRQWERKKP